MSESIDDFVVVDEETPDPHKIALERLNVLVDLFSKSLDAVNQSNILLKDELCAALSVTLQHSSPDNSVPIEDLIKTLKDNVTNTDEVRANYVKRMCSHLVAANEKSQSLLEENLSLKQTLTTQNEAHKKQIDDAHQIAQDIQSELDKVEGSTSQSNSEAVTIEDLCKQLNEIRDRVSKIDLKSQVAAQQSASSTVDQMTQAYQPPPICADRACLAQTDNTDSAVQTQILPPDDSNCSSFAQQAPEPETNSAPANPIYYLSEVEWPPEDVASNDHLTSERDTGPAVEEELGSQLQPSFSASEEEPWCPCCAQRFASRDDLETHLQNCLH